MAHPWESLIIGAVGGCCACFGRILMYKLRIDDPTSCIAVHTLSGVWGLLAVGLFIEEDQLETFSVTKGVFKGGNGYLLGVQLLAVVVLAIWSAVTSALILFAIKYTIGLRVTEEEEKLGADRVEHEMDYKKVDNSNTDNAFRGLNQFLRNKIEPLRSPRMKPRNPSVHHISKSFTIKIDKDENGREMKVESFASESSSSYSQMPVRLSSSGHLRPFPEERQRRRSSLSSYRLEQSDDKRSLHDPTPVLFLPKSPIN